MTLFIVAALLAFADGMQHLDRNAVYLAERVPELAWSRDAVIVTLSARLSIALIPTALVWFFASNFARWMVTVIGVGKLINVPAAVRIAEAGNAISPYWAASLIVGLIAVALLFTPDARRYFSRRREVNAAVFN